MHITSMSMQVDQTGIETKGNPRFDRIFPQTCPVHNDDQLATAMEPDEMILGLGI